MRKLLHYLILITILSGILLAGCNQEPAQETTGDMENNGPYADIEDGLVGETKALAQQMAEFAESEEIMLYTTDADIAENISAFASAVLQCNEPLSATRYIVDRNSISQNPSGGAMSHEEILSYCSQIYTSMMLEFLPFIRKPKTEPCNARCRPCWEKLKRMIALLILLHPGTLEYHFKAMYRTAILQYPAQYLNAKGTVMPISFLRKIRRLLLRRLPSVWLVNVQASLL